MRIDFRWVALLIAVGAASACARTASRHATRAAPTAFRGIYRVGPGISAFRPCGSDEEWWVRLSSGSAGLELRRRTSMKQDEAPSGGMRSAAPAGADAGHFQLAYAEVLGDTVALTAGPEVRRYQRELRLTRVVLVDRPAARAECL